MMNEIPVISITQDFNIDDEEENENEGAENIEDAHTDMEDLDSSGDDRGKSINGQTLAARRKVKTKKISDCATDIEDCIDSGSDCDSDQRNCDVELSLNEFLDQGVVEETASFDGKNKIKNSQRNKRASLIPPADEAGGVTDCEDYDASDEEFAIDIIDMDTVANHYFDNFLITTDDFTSQSVQNSSFVKNKHGHPDGRKKWRASTSKRVEMSDSDSEKPTNWGELSDVENFPVSDRDDDYCGKMKHSASALDVEEINMVASDVEESWVESQKDQQPEIDISFTNRHPKRTRTRKPKENKNALAVKQNSDEGITDVENLNSSDDDSSNIRKKLSIPIAFVSSGNKGLTDVEDFDMDEDCIASTSTDIRLPSPVREIIVMREDKEGEVAKKVMPLVTNSSLLAVEEYIEKGLTDTEDMSGNEEEYNNIDKYEIKELPDLAVDFGTVDETENITALKRNKYGNVQEPLTDIEEVRMGKQLRRKKSKPKSTKPKPFLSVGKDDDDQVLTENEDLYVDDDQMGQLKSGRNRIQFLQSVVNHENAVTDTEDISGDEEFYNKKPKEIDASFLSQEAFFSTITQSDDAKNRGNNPNEGYSKISTMLKTREGVDSSTELAATDVEDMVQSDADDLLNAIDTQRANSVTPNELRSAFNECSISSVHDQSKSHFDLRDEAQHIKGFGDIHESHTDNEFLDMEDK